MIDLSIGDPIIWDDYWPTVNASALCTGYPTTIHQSHQNLVSAIKKLHAAVGNIERPEDYEVVVGNGASQILQAAIASFNAGKEAYVYAKAPHFPRFRNFVAYSGQRQLTFTNDVNVIQQQQTLEIVTYPNNPDNSTSHIGEKGTFIVHDCSYLWPQYTVASLPVRTPSVAVFSLAKALGLAGVRIGWALVHKHAYAEKMRRFIETQGGGVSAIAQDAALVSINEELEKIRNGELTAFAHGNIVLSHRWVEVRAALANSQVKLLNTSGMFIWIEAPMGAALLDATIGIISAHGPAFGMSENYARINLACDEQSYRILLDGLALLKIR